MAWTNKEYQRAYKLAHQKKAHAADPEPRRAAYRRWYHANKAKAQAATNAWQMTNKERMRVARVEYVKKNPDKRRNAEQRRRLRTYGVSQVEYDALLSSQDHACAVCRRPFAPTQRISIDHCHATGRVRGLLCNSCNLAIGLFRDDPATLRRAARYVTEDRPAVPLTQQLALPLAAAK